MTYRWDLPLRIRFWDVLAIIKERFSFVDGLRREMYKSRSRKHFDMLSSAGGRFIHDNRKFARHIFYW